jgi:hypothetical protein
MRPKPVVEAIDNATELIARIGRDLLSLQDREVHITTIQETITTTNPGPGPGVRAPKMILGLDGQMHPVAQGAIFNKMGVQTFASGGENHVAQFAKGGDLRLWGERETGGEAYIPMAGNKRNRSMAILAQVAKAFGYALMPNMGGGGSLPGMDPRMRQGLQEVYNIISNIHIGGSLNGDSHLKKEIQKALDKSNRKLAQSVRRKK